MDFSQLNFKYSWRPYQSRVLNAVDEHLEDDKLHIVAAPGAGKTTLGIEVFKRLAQNALILSPTRVIRDQWIERLADFVECGNPFELAWVSNDLYTPKSFTSITYQALHAKIAQNEDAQYERDEQESEPTTLDSCEIKAFISSLKNAEISVLILDEAHHLRQEWWKVLTAVCDALPQITLVSLTATPPYDSDGHEWGKYEQLCGTIDEEISVPELVKANTLCPHQDYVWAVDASANERSKLREFDARVKQLFKHLLANETFLDMCKHHTWLTQPQVSTADIIKSPHVLIAILVLLKHTKQALPQNALALLDLTCEDVPKLTRSWWQKLIEAMLFSKTFAQNDEQERFITELKKQLRASELLHKRDLMLEHSNRLERSLSLSSAKIKGCLDIHRIEYKKRQQQLRQVILTDFIRDESLSNNTQIGETTLGSWPVFETLAKHSNINEDVALLTGRLSIVHESKVAYFKSDDASEKLIFTPITGLNGYVKVTGSLNVLTSSFTKLLCDGDIKTLIGTRALLGEGWDAPVVNSLVLASSVGSFMPTNQMRGRAIRLDKSSPQKASSIWHLVAVDKESYYGLIDFYNLQRRFLTFVGLAENSNAIESGFERLNSKLAFYFNTTSSMKFAVYANNKQMIKRFKNIEQLPAKWQRALTIDKTGRTLPSVETQAITRFKTVHLKNTFKYLTQEFLLGMMSALAMSLSFMKYPQSATVMLWFLAGGFAYGFVKNLPKTLKALRIMLLHLPVDGSLKQIGNAVIETLAKTNKLTTPLRMLDIKTSQGYDGSLTIALTGGTFYESSLFADCMAEVLAPIDNPRYLVVREGDFAGFARKDYHAVPTCVGVKKQFAESYVVAWNKYVGSADLIYTRNFEGRKSLLKAKMHAFSSVFANDMRRVDKWH
ncbi:DEAD/DEAH box helicase family protein [Pseudoalteromonas spongiae]|uniref:DEAD/DEAH box helicase family protein n=1 Tax=Pseudoalteromonas spongiae TaxID=298657 RepID=UPI000C2D3273|nr:DEAD/DEAH box helicase family protein [Pseudoalteromonas spongiae]